MHGLKHRLMTGAWVTAERIRVYAWILIIFWGLAIIGLVATSSAGLDAWGRPLGTDFANVWSAGLMVLDGQALGVYDPPSHYLAQKNAFENSEVPYYGWHYPPFFLMIAAALALLPYGGAVVAWMAVTLPCYVMVLRRIQPGRLTLLAAIAFPGAIVNLLHGQNGFISAALMGLGLILLNRRPVLAGTMFGLLSYKPQFGLLIPLVLIATGRWKVFASACVTLCMLIAVSSAVFGLDIWQAFYANTQFTREVVLQAGAMGWEKQQSLFAAARAFGASLGWAYGLQGGLALVVVGCVFWLWRGRADVAVKSAGLVVGALLVTPYVMDYDMVMLALCIAWLTSHGLRSEFLDWEKTVLAAVWMVPLFARVVAHVAYVPLGLMVMMILFVVILRRAQFENHSGNVTGPQRV